MAALLTLAGSAFVLTLAVTPGLRRLALHWRFVDVPDHRKLHSRPTARVGGIAVLISYAVASYIAFLISGTQVPLIWRMAPAVLIIFVTGLADDLWDIRPWQKFAGQTVAALAAYRGGVHILFGGQPVSEWICLPATVFWLVLCTNALNLIDGMDGLATGVGLFATTTTLVAALLQNNYGLALAVAPLTGCLLGFLRYNYNPATVFLGDSGSLAIGFFLGCCSVIWSEKSATILGMTAPLLALSIPLLDTGLAVARRFLRGRPIFGADRGHIHHRLLDRGWTPQRAVLLIYGVSGAGSLFALLAMYRRTEGAVIVLFFVAALAGIRRLEYVELQVAARMLLGGAFTGLLNSHVELETLEARIGSAPTAAACWEAVGEAAAAFGLRAAGMELGGSVLEGLR